MKRIEIHPEAVEKAKKFQINDVQLGFGKYMSPIMIKVLYKDGAWQKAELLPYGPLELDPCAKVLHYAQEIFEGMKAYRWPEGNIAMFRPELNARRFNQSARRMAMPEVPEDLFVEACETITAYSKNIVPKRLGESLYLRPFMIASEVGLGIKPAKEFLFIVVASPSGNYFGANAVKVLIERKDSRAAPGGIGAAKTGGNYAASLQAYSHTLEQGCDQTMWLDSSEHRYIEEMSGMNFFAVIDGKLVTPPLTDTLLDGITRRSLIELALIEKMPLTETRMDINELLKQVATGTCTEAFVCGTASVLAPISFFKDADGSIYHLRDAEGNVAMKLREKLISIQAGRHEAPAGWVYHVRDVAF